MKDLSIIKNYVLGGKKKIVMRIGDKPYTITSENFAETYPKAMNALLNSKEKVSNQVVGDETSSGDKKDAKTTPANTANKPTEQPPKEEEKSDKDKAPEEKKEEQQPAKSSVDVESDKQSQDDAKNNAQGSGQAGGDGKDDNEKKEQQGDPGRGVNGQDIPQTQMSNVINPLSMESFINLERLGRAEGYDKTIADFFIELLKLIPPREIKKVEDGIDPFKFVQASIFHPQTMLDELKIKELEEESEIHLIVDSHDAYDGDAYVWRLIVSTARKVGIKVWRAEKLSNDYYAEDNPEQKLNGTHPHWRWAEKMGIKKGSTIILVGDGCTGGVGSGAWSNDHLRKSIEDYNMSWLYFYDIHSDCGCDLKNRAVKNKMTVFGDINTASAFNKLEPIKFIKK